MTKRTSSATQRRPYTAPTGEEMGNETDGKDGKDGRVDVFEKGGWAVTNSSAEDDEANYYVDDFEAPSPTAAAVRRPQMRPQTAPGVARPRAARKKKGGRGRGERGGRRRNGSRQRRARPSTTKTVTLSSKKRFNIRSGRVKHKHEWKGSPSTNKELTYSSTANRVIKNVQAIPRDPPRIPGMEEMGPETDHILTAQLSNVTSIPSQLDDVKQKLSRSMNRRGHSASSSGRLGGGGSHHLSSSSSLLKSTTTEEDDDDAASGLVDGHRGGRRGGHGERGGRGGGGEGGGEGGGGADRGARHSQTWIGSPSSKLPFTFSRTANIHFKQKQMWPHYDAVEDAGCSFTKTKSYKRFHKKQMEEERKEKMGRIEGRHREMRKRQRGALSAAIAMTERELPNEVDDEIERMFFSITDKLFFSWKDRRGEMMKFPSICEGLAKNGFVNESDMMASLHAVGIELTTGEFSIFCRVLYPKNSKGDYSCLKICDHVMSGRNLLHGEGDEEEEKEETMKPLVGGGIVLNL